MARDPYQVLGVEPEATKEEITAAYRRSAMRVHPDRNPGDTKAGEKLVELNVAYAVLSDDSKRREYDKSRMRPQGRIHVGFSNNGGAGGGGGFDFDMNSWGQSPFHRASTPGKDVELELRLSLKEAVLGTTKTIRARTGHEVMCNACAGSRCAAGSGRTPCAACAGTGKVFYLGQGGRAGECKACGGHGDIPFRACKECLGKGNARSEREVTLRVPSGVSEDQRLRLAGQGEVGSWGPPGDMFVTLKIEEDQRFSRKGSDLHTVVRVPFHIAAGGKPVKVVGIDDVEHTVELASKMRPGETTIAIPNAGVPSMTGSRGRLLVLLQTDLPAPKTPRGQLLLRELLDELSGSRPAVGSPDDD